MDRAKFLQSLKGESEDSLHTAVLAPTQVISEKSYSFTQKVDLASDAPLSKLKFYFERHSGFKFESISFEELNGIMVTATAEDWRAALESKNYPASKGAVSFCSDMVNVDLS